MHAFMLFRYNAFTKLIANLGWYWRVYDGIRRRRRIQVG
jgi:hypothetical protein